MTRPEAAPMNRRMLTADDVDRTDFLTRRSWGGALGYDDAEVDAFMDDAAFTIAELTRRLANREPWVMPDRWPPLALGAVLTEAEQTVVDLLGQAWTLLASEVVVAGHNRAADLAELVVPMHTLENAVLAQAAARTHPDTYRALGATLRTGDDDR